MSDIQDIKNRIDITEFISGTVALKKTGKSYSGYCPFHANHNTEAFFVFPDTKTWHCFGCSTGGDIISFVMKRDNIQFIDALKVCAEYAGITLRSFADKGDTLSLRQLNREMINRFSSVFDAYSDYSDVYSSLNYLRERGFTDKTIVEWELGYGLFDDYTQNYISKSGIPDDISGLSLIRNRIVIPIKNQTGDVIAFGSRSLGSGLPKYINTHNNYIFEKRKTLFGLDKALSHIMSSNRAIVVEGYFDCISMHQHGINNTVAIMGSSISSEQMSSLSKICDEIVLMLDPDKAGENGVIKSVTSMTDMVRTDNISYSDTGTLITSTNLKCLVRVVEGLTDDPDNMVRDNVDNVIRLIEESRYIGEYIIDKYAKGITTEKSKQDTIDKIMGLIYSLNASPLRQSSLISYSAKLLGIPDDLLLNYKSKKKYIALQDTNDTKLTKVVRYLVTYPYCYFTATRLLKELNLSEININDFIYDSYLKECFITIMKSLEQNDIYPRDYIKTFMPDIETIDITEENAVIEIALNIIDVRKYSLDREKVIISSQLVDNNLLDKCMKDLHSLQLARDNIGKFKPIVLGW